MASAMDSARENSQSDLESTVTDKSYEAFVEEEHRVSQAEELIRSKAEELEHSEYLLDEEDKERMRLEEEAALLQREVDQSNSVHQELDAEYQTLNSDVKQTEQQLQQSEAEAERIKLERAKTLQQVDEKLQLANTRTPGAPGTEPRGACAGDDGRGVCASCVVM